MKPTPQMFQTCWRALAAYADVIRARHPAFPKTCPFDDPEIKIGSGGGNVRYVWTWVRHERTYTWRCRARLTDILNPTDAPFDKAEEKLARRQERREKQKAEEAAARAQQREREDREQWERLNAKFGTTEVAR